MKLIDVLEVATEIYTEKAAIEHLRDHGDPGQTLDLPVIKQGGGKDRLEFHVTVVKPAA